MADTASITYEDIRVTLGDSVPEEAAGESRRRVSAVLGHIRQPVLSARVRVTRHGDPAVDRPFSVQANVDVNGHLLRVQAQAETLSESLAVLEDKLRHAAERLAARWRDRNDRRPSGGEHEWRHTDEPSHHPSFYPRPPEERRIVRHKAFGLAVSTADEAAFDMNSLDYDFHLFTELGTGQDSVIYRAGPTGYRLAQIHPEPDRIAPGALPLTVSDQPAAVLTTAAAVNRLNLSGQPFLFFRQADGQRRGRILYRRYDGHYGLITPAD
jgi:ribosome-associated translation inhibitor RaiA